MISVSGIQANSRNLTCKQHRERVVSRMEDCRWSMGCDRVHTEMSPLQQRCKGENREKGRERRIGRGEYFARERRIGRRKYFFKCITEFKVS